MSLAFALGHSREPLALSWLGRDCCYRPHRVGKARLAVQEIGFRELRIDEYEM
jgi:hypothetical protein